MLRRSQLLLALLVLAPGTAVRAAPAPVPSASLRESFPGCTWGEVKGRLATIWAFSCDAQSAHAHLVADDAVPGFRLRDDTDPAGRIVIRFFDKGAGQPVAAVLPAVRAASPGRDTARCVLRSLPPNPDLAGHLFALEPTGAEGKAWADSQRTATMPDAPCGPLGIAYAGDRVFREMADDPTHVVFVDMGSEIQIFDPATLRHAEP